MSSNTNTTNESTSNTTPTRLIVTSREDDVPLDDTSPRAIAEFLLARIPDSTTKSPTIVLRHKEGREPYTSDFRFEVMLVLRIARPHQQLVVMLPHEFEYYNPELAKSAPKPRKMPGA